MIADTFHLKPKPPEPPAPSLSSGEKAVVRLALQHITLYVPPAKMAGRFGELIKDLTLIAT